MTKGQARAQAKRAKARLDKADEAMRQATANMRHAAHEAHEAGISDAELSELLGVSRARAYQLRTGRNR